MILEDYLAQNNIRIFYRPLPMSIEAVSRLESFGASVIINILLDASQQKAALEHELQHIEQGHLHYAASEPCETMVRESPLTYVFGDEL
jgi:hypothetical protein